MSTITTTYVIGDRVVTADSLECPTREMGYVTGTIAAVDDDDPSEVLVDWDHQRIAYDRGSNFVYNWVPVADIRRWNDGDLTAAVQRLLNAARAVLSHDKLNPCNSVIALEALQAAESVARRVYGVQL